MDARFVLPVTTAAALHAFLFLGTGSDGRIPIKRPAKTDVPVIETRIVLPPDPIEDPPAPAMGPTKGSPDADRPTLSELVSTNSAFEMPTLPDYPPPKTHVERISFEPPGDPNGIAEGIQNARIVDSIHLDNKPHTRSQTPPTYPMEARNTGLTGEVWVEFVVDPNGRVSTARVVRSSHSLFESATLRAVQLWRFEPGKKNGRPVSFRMIAPVVFSLNE